MVESQKINDRWYPDHPMVAVSSIILNENRVLLIKRGEDPGKGKWSIPGGRVELGETLFEAARREVFEECSIEVEIESVFNTTERIIKDEEGRVKYHFIMVDVLAKYSGGEPEAQSDAEECRWVSAEEMTRFDITSTELHDILMRALARHEYP